MKQIWIIIPIYLAALISLYLVAEAAKKSIKESLYSFNNPPAVNNLVFNSIQSWRYNLETISNSRALTYPDTSQNITLFDLTNEASIVFRFSGNMCSPCVDFVIDRIKFCIQDFKENERIIFIYSDANPALAENYFVKQSWYIPESFHQELDDIMIPYLCILDSEHRIKSLYIPDMAYPELLDKYLEMARDKLKVNEMK